MHRNVKRAKKNSSCSISTSFTRISWKIQRELLRFPGATALRNPAAREAAERFAHLRVPLPHPRIRSMLRDSDLQLAVYQVEG